MKLQLDSLEPTTELFGISLMSMLTVPRFSRTLHEEALVQRLLKVPGAYLDAYGNVHCKQGESRTIFSAHTDTVHKRSDTAPYTVQYEAGMLQRASAVPAKGGGVLGADCATGIFIMLAMLHSGVPGHYVWHRDEETGGAGSTFAADALDVGAYDRCIAFDRRGYCDVITSMAHGKTASDEFATALASALNANLQGKDAMYQPDPTGVFTDSANYTQVVPECTNISVGYDCEHSQYESQDFEFLVNLIGSLLQVQWEDLPVQRDVSDTGPCNWWDSYDYGYNAYLNPADTAALEDLNDLRAICARDPAGVAEFLYYQAGADAAELQEYINVQASDVPF